MKIFSKNFFEKSVDNPAIVCYTIFVKRKENLLNQKGKTMLNRDIFADDIIMTVKELKMILEKYEDDDNVYLIGLDDDCAVLRINEDDIAET